MSVCIHNIKLKTEKNVLQVHRLTKVFHLSENILVMHDWFPSMSELVSSDTKINCSTSDGHKVSLFREVKNLVVQ